MAEKISVALASAGNRLREGVDDTLRTPPPKVQRGISAEAALIPRAQKLRRTKTMLSRLGRRTYLVETANPSYLVMGVTLHCEYEFIEFTLQLWRAMNLNSFSDEFNV